MCIRDRSYTTPKKIAGVKDKTAHVSLTMIQEGKNYTNYMRTTYTNRSIDGIQYISQRDNSESQSGWVELYNNIRSTYKTQTASLNYALSRNRGNEYSWKAELNVNYTNQDDEYLMPNSVQNAGVYHCRGNPLFLLFLLFQPVIHLFSRPA